MCSSDLKDASATENAVVEAEKIKKISDALRKKIEQRKKEAEEKGLKDIDFEPITKKLEELDKLQAAFQNIYATMDEIDTFKVAALDSMQKTVTALSAEIEKSRSYIDRVHQSEERGSGIDALGTPER